MEIQEDNLRARADQMSNAVEAVTGSDRPAPACTFLKLSASAESLQYQNSQQPTKSIRGSCWAFPVFQPLWIMLRCWCRLLSCFSPVWNTGQARLTSWHETATQSTYWRLVLLTISDYYGILGCLEIKVVSFSGLSAFCSSTWLTILLNWRIFAILR